jgi:hypothetical protein
MDAIQTDEIRETATQRHFRGDNQLDIFAHGCVYWQAHGLLQ